MPDPFGSVLRAYYETLDRYRLLTYGQQVVRAVRELERPELAAEIHGDAAPPDRRRVPGRQPGAGAADRAAHRAQTSSCASSATTSRRSTSGAGRTSRNIVTFAERYPSVATFEITTNRRSRRRSSTSPTRFARSIPDRHRQDDAAAPRRRRRPEPEVVVWSAPSELEEAGWIASLILDLADAGVPLPGHRGAGARPRCVPAAGRAVRHVRHPGAAGRALGPVRPARGGACSATRSRG